MRTLPPPISTCALRLQCSRRRKGTIESADGGAPVARPAGTSTGVNLRDLPKGTMKEVPVPTSGGRTMAILLTHTHTGKVSATSAKCP